MHTREARADGESEVRPYQLDAWREAPEYSERERAALAWSEAVTLVTDGRVPDEVYWSVSQTSLTRNWWTSRWQSSRSNAWNRLSISFRALPATQSGCDSGKGPG